MASQVAKAMVRARELCGGSAQSGDEQAGPMSTDSGYFPMSVGAEWNYKVSTFAPQPQTAESSLFLLSRSQDAEGINFEEGNRMGASSTWRLSQKGNRENDSRCDTPPTARLSPHSWKDVVAYGAV
jgi:hypothetical protein